MSDKKDWYFANAPVRGAGKMFLLLLPQEIVRGSDAGKLIGSVVREVDYGFLFKKQCPEPVSALQPGAAIKELARAAGVKPADMKGKRILGGAELSLDKVSDFSVGAKANFPGSPVAGGVDLDWKRVKSVDVAFGEGSYAVDLRMGLVENGLKAARRAKADYASQLFDDDYMIVTSVLIAKGLSVKVTSKEQFSADFKAAAQRVSDTHAAVSFNQVDDMAYELKVAETKEHLFGIAAVEPENVG